METKTKVVSEDAAILVPKLTNWVFGIKHFVRITPPVFRWTGYTLLGLAGIWDAALAAGQLNAIPEGIRLKITIWSNIAGIVGKILTSFFGFPPESAIAALKAQIVTVQAEAITTSKDTIVKEKEKIEVSKDKIADAKDIIIDTKANP
jgi:hypothetical protein